MSGPLSDLHQFLVRFSALFTLIVCISRFHRIAPQRRICMPASNRIRHFLPWTQKPKTNKLMSSTWNFDSFCSLNAGFFQVFVRELQENVQIDRFLLENRQIFGQLQFGEQLRQGFRLLSWFSGRFLTQTGTETVLTSDEKMRTSVDRTFSFWWHSARASSD